jgi:hypothetical protein
MDIHWQIHELEARLLSPEVRANEAALTALLADDFVEFGVSGNVWKKADVIADLKGEVFVMFAAFGSSCSEQGEQGEQTRLGATPGIQMIMTTGSRPSIR